jgi:hypothetical protein
MTEAPNAGGLFLGDYQGLASSGSQFVALLAIANRDAANRSDVHAVRRDPDATAARAPRFSARATVPPLSRQASAQFDAAQHEATLAAMERRVADWGLRVGARRQPRRRTAEHSKRPVHRRAVAGVAQRTGVERAARAQRHRPAHRVAHAHADAELRELARGLAARQRVA